MDVLVEPDGVKLRPQGTIEDEPSALAQVAPGRSAMALALWGEDLQLPDPELVERLLAGVCHVWHAGLLLGQQGRPAAWDSCHGRSMLNVDVDARRESTSWRLSTRALIVRPDVLSRLGGFDAGFDTSAGAALDAGLRWIQSGALIRHVPDLLATNSSPLLTPPPSAADEIRVVRRRLGTLWAGWSLYRGVRTGALPLKQGAKAAHAAITAMPTPDLKPGLAYPHEARSVAPEFTAPRVTVLIPTVGRNQFLAQLLSQLAQQSRPPDEVMVVDQNPATDRIDPCAVAPNLPVRVLFLDLPGQCTARNSGLRASSGTHILFLDDDDEVPPDLIEQHLAVLADPDVAASCGLIDDRESGAAPPSERFRKVSAVFPTNNTMIRRDVLLETGLFDPTYDRGARADHDLGMRSYLQGNLHVHDPRPRVFHHHAPEGGLRTHKARVRTRGNSRSTVLARHLRTPTDVYLGLRYHSTRQVEEDLALSTFATLRGSGSALRRGARLVVQLCLLPDTIHRTSAARRRGAELMQHRPDLVELDDRIQ